ncbi:MAG: tyrosine-type recombinase/integrase [Bacillota bacterium]
MPIKHVSKFSIKEMCEDLKIDYNDFLVFINNKRDGNVAHVNESLTALFVIDDFINTLLRQEIIGVKSKNTVKYYLSFLKRLKDYIISNNKELLFSEINEALLYNMTESIERSSINTYIGILQRLCSFASEHGYTSKNLGFKFNKIKTSYLPRYFTDSLLKQIFELVEKRRCSLLWKTIFITLLGTGLRVKELEQLRIKDVSFNENYIYTLGKGNKERFVPLYPQVKNSLIIYLDKTGVSDFEKAKNSYLFSRDKGDLRFNPVSVRSIQYNLFTIRSKIGFDSNLTVHSFRHSFAVNCLKSNMKLMYLCQILGHESPSTTARYTKLLPKDLQHEVHEKFPFPLEELIKELIK